MSAESVDSMQSGTASIIPSAAPAPQATRAAAASRPDQALSATGASAPPTAAPPAVAASPQSATARGQPPVAAAAQVPQPVGTTKVTRSDLATARLAPNKAPVLDSTGSLFGLADSTPTHVSYQTGTPPPPQPAGNDVLLSPNQATAPSATAAVSAPTAKAATDVSGPDVNPSPAASTAALSIPRAPSASGVRPLAHLAGDAVLKPGWRISSRTILAMLPDQACVSERVRGS